MECDLSIDRAATVHGCCCLLGDRIRPEANAQGSELEHCIRGDGDLDTVYDGPYGLEHGSDYSRHPRGSFCRVRASGR